MTVTTVIPTHHRPKLLMRAVASVLSQTMDDWRCFVVGDAADAQTVALMRGLVAYDSRFDFWNLPRQRYPDDTRQRWWVAGTQAFNHGLERVDTEWFSYLADDDMYLPQHHAALTEVADDAGVIYGQSAVLEPSGHVKRGVFGSQFPPNAFDIVQGSYLMRTSLGYRATEQPVGESWDADWWHRIIADGVRFTRAQRLVHLYFPAADNWTEHGV